MIKTSLQIGLIGFIFVFVWAMINGVDLAYQVAMLLFTLASLASLFWLQKKTSSQLASPDPDHYLDGVVRAGVIATIFWGVVGFLVGVYIAFELAFPVLNFDWPYTSFGRLRPLHTSAVIFAFGGNVASPLCQSDC